MSRLWQTIISIIVILLFLVGFRSMILTDAYVGDAFQALMGTLPFAEPFSKVVCTVLGYNVGNPLVSAHGFIVDILKLMVISTIQPFATWLLSLIFLRIPDSIQSIDDRETFMGTIGYRIRSTLIQIISAPLLACFAAWLIHILVQWAAANFGYIGAVLIGLVSTLVLTAISSLPMFLLGASITIAFLWRYLVTMLGGMLNALVTILCSISLYYAILNGIPSHIMGSIITLIGCLILVDILIQSFQRLLAGLSLTGG